jgi:hypothetical protein
METDILVKKAFRLGIFFPFPCYKIGSLILLIFVAVEYYTLKIIKMLQIKSNERRTDTHVPEKPWLQYILWENVHPLMMPKGNDRIEKIT